MDDDDAFFAEQPQQQQVQEITTSHPTHQFTMPRPQPHLHTKPVLRMVEIDKQLPQYRFVPFHIEKKEEKDEDYFGSQTCVNQHYEKSQLVYKKFINDQINKHNDIQYFSGAFIPKNLLPYYLQDDSYNLDPILSEYYDSRAFTPPVLGKDTLKFDSNFESGNLFCAFQVGNYEYDLMMQQDINSHGSTQWFFFSVQNLKPFQEYTFSIINFTKYDSLFNYGMAPAVFSLAAHSKHGIGWHRKGKNVEYCRSELFRENSRKHYYKLTFTITTQYNSDKLLIAHSYPYTYSQLKQYIKKVQETNQSIVQTIKVGESLGRKTIWGLVISEKKEKNDRGKDNRKAIVIMARQHPGETQGSFVCQGVIQKFIEKNKQSEFLRKNFRIFVIPMVNPDGVSFGNYRTNLAGKDLNRKWDATQKQTNCPEVTAIKNFLITISKNHEIAFILDLHGHSKKFGSFFYGNPSPQNPERVRMFPYTCSRLNEAIQYMDCTFYSQEAKRKAARVFLSYMFHQIHVYTFQSSFFAYFKNHKKQPFTPASYANLGASLVEALYIILQNEHKTTQIAEFSLSKSNGNIPSFQKDQRNNSYNKYWKQLHSAEELLRVGEGEDSGSESKPEEGEVEQLPDDVEIFEKAKVELSKPLSQKMPKIRVSTKKTSSRDKEERELSKPSRNIKYLPLKHVDAILPDKYHMGLQPSKRREYAQTGKEFGTQTEDIEPIKLISHSSAEIQSRPNMIHLQRHSRRHSELLPTTISSVHPNRLEIISRMTPSQLSKYTQRTHRERRMLNAQVQTIITFDCRQDRKNPRKKSDPWLESSLKLEMLQQAKKKEWQGKSLGDKKLNTMIAAIDRESIFQCQILNIQKKHIFHK